MHKIIKQQSFGVFTNKTSLPFGMPPAAARRYAKVPLRGNLTTSKGC